jgi:hypothetical protein
VTTLFSHLLSLSLSPSLVREIALPLSTILICLQVCGVEAEKEREREGGEREREGGEGTGGELGSGDDKVLTEGRAVDLVVGFLLQQASPAARGDAALTARTTRVVLALGEAWAAFAASLVAAASRGRRALSNRRLRSPTARTAARLGVAVDDFVTVLDELGIERERERGGGESIRAIVGRSARSRRASGVREGSAEGGGEGGAGGGSTVESFTGFLPIAAVPEEEEGGGGAESASADRTASRSEQLFGVGTVSIAVPTLLARLGEESRRPPNPTEAALLEHALDPFGTGQVSPVSFDEFLLGFGPLRHCVRNFLAVLRAPWFGGHLTSREAELLLADAEPGTFLVRFRRSADAYFDAATVMDGGAVRHIHIAASATAGDRGRFSVRAADGTERHFSSLPRLVDEHSAILRTPLPSPLTNEPWFHGDLSSDDAADLLADTTVGTFLVRFSGSTPGTFAISWHATTETVSHVRFSRSVVSRRGADVVYEYTVTGETLRTFASVSMLLDSYAFLSDPLPNPQATMNSLMRSLRSRKMSRRHSSSSRRDSRRESRRSTRSPSPDSRDSSASSRPLSPAGSTLAPNPLRLPSVGEISPRNPEAGAPAAGAGPTASSTTAGPAPEAEGALAEDGVNPSASPPRLSRLLRRGSKVASKSGRFDGKAVSTTAPDTATLEEGGSLRNKARSLLRMKKRSSVSLAGRPPPAVPAADPWSAAASAGARSADQVPQPTVQPAGAWPAALLGPTSSVRFAARPIDDATLAALAAPAPTAGAAGDAGAGGDMAARNRLLAEFWVDGERELSATLKSLANEAAPVLAPLADASLVATVFEPVRTLADAHAALLTDRLATLSAELAANPSSDAAVRAAPVLINIVSFVEDALLTFCRSLPRILVAMDELARTPGAADAAVTAAAVVAAAAGLTTVPSLFALLLAPVSRAYRYPDEIRSLRSLTPASHADHAFLDTCIVDSSHAAGAIGTIHAEASAVQEVLDAVDDVAGGRETMLSQGGTDRLVKRRLELTEPMVAVATRAAVLFFLFSDCVWVVDATSKRILGTAPREAVAGRFERPGELVLAHRFQGGSEWMRLVCTEPNTEARIRTKMSM